MKGKLASTFQFLWPKKGIKSVKWQIIRDLDRRICFIDLSTLQQIRRVLKPLKSTSEILAKYLRPPKSSLLSCLNGSLACVQSKKRFMFPHFLTQSPLKKVIKPLIGQIAIKTY